MKIHSKNIKTNKEEILLLEQSLEIKLPEDLKEFLLKYNGGVPSKLNFTAKGYGSSILKELYGINKNEPIRDIQNTTKMFKNSIPDKYIPIGCDQLGNQIILSIKDEHKNKIYFWWHEGETNSENKDSNIFLIEDNFTSFLNSLENISEPVKGNFEDYFRNEDYNNIKNLIGTGWNINTPFEKGMRPIELMVLRNNSEIVNLLISKNANIDKTVHLAISNNLYNMMEILLSNGANPDEYDNMNRPALHHAIIRGDSNAVKILLKYKANKQIKDKFDRDAYNMALKVKSKGEYNMDDILKMLED